MSQDITDYFHKDFQRAIVAHTIRCPRLLKQIQEGSISQNDVDLPIHQAIFQAVKEIIRVQGGVDQDKAIPLDLLALQLKGMLNAGIIYREEKDALIEEIDTMYQMDLNVDYFSKILPIYLSETRISKLIKSHKSGSAQDFASRIAKIVEETKQKSQDRVVYNPLMECMLGDKPVEVVPCGINTIDSRMSGGLGKGEFGIICGVSGLGKTTLAVNFCWGAALSNRRALIITLEIPAKKISERLYSRATGIPYNRIRHGDNGDTSAVNREVWEIMSRIPDEVRTGNFMVWDFSLDSCCLKDIDNRLAALSSEEMPDMVFLDWLDALESDPSERQGGFVPKELRHQLQNFSKGCADIAKKYDVAFWATTQSNASGDNKRGVRMTNAAEGFAKAWRSSCFLGISATDQDRGDGIMTVTASKMRDGAIFEVQIQSKLDIQTFRDMPPDTEFSMPAPANFTPISQR